MDRTQPGPQACMEDVLAMGRPPTAGVPLGFATDGLTYLLQSALPDRIPTTLSFVWGVNFRFEPSDPLQAALSDWFLAPLKGTVPR